MHILVASCAAYADAWQPFAELFRIHWPDCPYAGVLFADGAEQGLPLFRVKIQPDEGWIANLARELRCVHDQTVLLLQEDFFLCDRVDQARMARLDTWLQESNYAALRLMPCPGADGPLLEDCCAGSPEPGRIGAVGVDAPYRASLQATLWKTDLLRQLVGRMLGHGGRTPADFERLGQDLSRDLALVAWVREDDKRLWPFSYLVSAIDKGRWSPGAITLCKAHGIPISGQRERILVP